MYEGGLGQLMDGRIGYDDVEVDFVGFGKGEQSLSSSRFLFMEDVLARRYLTIIFYQKTISGIDTREVNEQLMNPTTNYWKGYEWVGWQNKTESPRPVPLEMTYEFDAVRNFSRIDIHVNNDYRKHVQVWIMYADKDKHWFTCTPR